MSSDSEFPVHWENPDDANLYWTRDAVHEPRPSLPLRRSFSRQIIGPGVERTMQVYQMPGQSRSILVNGYMFETKIADAPDVTKQKQQRAHAILDEHIADLPRRWYDEFEPELRRDLAAWRAFDLPDATWDGLAQHFAQMTERMVRHWEIHFFTVFPVLHSTRVLSQLYEKLTGDHDEQAPYILVAGFPNKTTERDMALWQLTELARQSPAVTNAFTAHAPNVLMPVLRALSDPASQNFVAVLDDYRSQYGERGEGSLHLPTWHEDPTFVLMVIKAYLAGARREPATELQAVANEREQMIAETLTKIPVSERDAFMQTLQRAQAIAPLRETHAFYIDQASVAHFRYAVVEMAKRLAQMGVLKKPDDVFYLELNELREVIHYPESANVKALIAQRRTDHARWSQLAAPSAIGTPPTEPQSSDPEQAKFFRPINTDVPAGHISELKGAAGSRGLARGRAVVVLSEREFARVQPGDILVCATTFPPWTPLFRVISGLVTDAGGVLSHGAIVAREYKLPAVVGTGIATRVIGDGTLLEVDGTKGVVKIIETGD